MSTNARTSAILSVSLKTRESVSLQKSCYVAGSITSQSFPDFLNLSESCQKKAVLVQRHNTSLHSKFRQTALKLTPKGLDYTQIDTLREPRITDLWFWEVLGQSQSWLRTMQTDLWKLYINSRIHLWILNRLFKNQTLVHAQKLDCVPLRKVYQTKDIQTWSESVKSFQVWVFPNFMASSLLLGRHCL